jgi:23S rRNA (cytosine1962-C5)-methyltransferase
MSAKPLVLTTKGLDDYALIDSGHGRKLERFGGLTLNRPEEQAIWTPKLPPAAWEDADATFTGDVDEEGAGRWNRRPVSENHGPVAWRATFACQFTSFRHVGAFPEQEAHFPHAAAPRGSGKRAIPLNLFGYTGLASLVASAAGAEVTHVDASKKAVAWARENQALSKLEAKPIRWIVDDAQKFAAREVRRGKRFDAILLDPPKFGRGPKNEVWDLFRDLPEMLRLCRQLLKPDGFLILTAYAIALVPLAAPAFRGGARTGRRIGSACARGSGRRSACDLALLALERAVTADPPRPGSFKKITSLANPLVKEVRALQQKKHRDESGLFIAEGQKLVRDAVDGGWRVDMLAYAAADVGEAAIGALAAETKACGGTVLEVSSQVLEKITRRENPQSVVGVFRQRFAPETEIGKGGIWVALDRVRDPGNLGTILRTAVAAGMRGVALVVASCDPFSLEAVRATMGSIFHTCADLRMA